MAHGATGAQIADYRYQPLLGGAVAVPQGLRRRDSPGYCIDGAGAHKHGATAHHERAIEREMTLPFVADLGGQGH